MNLKRLTSLVSCFGVLAFVLVATAGCEDMSSADSGLPILSASSYPQLSLIEPPAPKSEEIPILQDPTTTVWRAGYWEQSGLGFSWVSGEIVARPSPTAVWAQSSWERREYGWAFVPGFWQ